MHQHVIATGSRTPNQKYNTHYNFFYLYLKQVMVDLVSCFHLMSELHSNHIIKPVLAGPILIVLHIPLQPLNVAWRPTDQEVAYIMFYDLSRHQALCLRAHRATLHRCPRMCFTYSTVPLVCVLAIHCFLWLPECIVIVVMKVCIKIPRQITLQFQRLWQAVRSACCCHWWPPCSGKHRLHL